MKVDRGMCWVPRVQNCSCEHATNRLWLARLLIGSAMVMAGSAWAQAAIQTFNSSGPANNASTRSSWLSAMGIGVPENLVNFESGFVNNQNVSGVPGLFPGGLVITDTGPGTPAATIRSGAGTIGGSNPVGTFSLIHDEQAYLELDFSARPVDYVAFQDIDHTGTTGVVWFVGGGSASVSLEGTNASSNSAEFFGIYRNDTPRITRIQLDATGDGTWGIDTIEYGIVPEPMSLTIVGLSVLGLMRRRRSPGR